MLRVSLGGGFSLASLILTPAILRAYTALFTLWHRQNFSLIFVFYIYSYNPWSIFTGVSLPLLSHTPSWKYSKWCSHRRCMTCDALLLIGAFPLIIWRVLYAFSARPVLFLVSIYMLLCCTWLWWKARWSLISVLSPYHLLVCLLNTVLSRYLLYKMFFGICQ